MTPSVYMDPASQAFRHAACANPAAGGAYFGSVAREAKRLISEGESYADAIDTAFGLVVCPFPALSDSDPSPLERRLVAILLGD